MHCRWLSDRKILPLPGLDLEVACGVGCPQHSGNRSDMMSLRSEPSGRHRERVIHGSPQRAAGATGDAARRAPPEALRFSNCDGSSSIRGRRHAEGLRRSPTKARDFVFRHAGVEAVGLIPDAGASGTEARSFLAALEKIAGRRLQVAGFLGVIQRAFAVAILRANFQAALDNLPNGEVGATLPVLVATKSAFRFGEVRLRAGAVPRVVGRSA
jgi:hypothetical protein